MYLKRLRRTGTKNSRTHQMPKGQPTKIYIYSLGYMVVVLIVGLSFYILERSKISTEDEEGREKEIKRVIFEVDKTMSNNVIHKP